MNPFLLFDLPLLKSSTYSKMTLRKNVSVSEHAALVHRLQGDGYVCRAAYVNEGLHTGIYEKDGEIVTVLRVAEEGDLRVTWEKAAYNDLTPLTALQSDGAPVTLTQIGIGAYGVYDDDPMIGMLYLIRLADGSAILVDGGMPTDGCADDVFRALESHGIARDEKGRYRIAAWIFTHAHPDHVGAFQSFAPRYHDRATVQYLLYNFPGDDRVAAPDCDYAAFEKTVDAFFPEAKRCIPRAGTAYGFGGKAGGFPNVVLRFFCSPELLYAPDRRIPYFNNTSLHFQLEAGGVRVLFPGDGGDAVAERVLACIAPSVLKSDLVQITHHGLYTNSHVTRHTAEEHALMTRAERDAWEAERHIHPNMTRLYETADPSIGLWPMGDTNGQPRNGRTTVMQDWSRRYGQVAHFVDLTDNVASGYDGVNLVRNGDLITYISSSETDQMITRFALASGKATLLDNARWVDFAPATVPSENN